MIFSSSHCVLYDVTLTVLEGGLDDVNKRTAKKLAYRDGFGVSTLALIRLSIETLKW